MNLDVMMYVLLRLEACETGIKWIKRLIRTSPPNGEEWTPEKVWKACPSVNNMVWLVVSAGFCNEDIQEGLVAAVKQAIEWESTTSKLLSSYFGGSSLQRNLHRRLVDAADSKDWVAYDFNGLSPEVLRAHWPWKDVEEGLVHATTDGNGYTDGCDPGYNTYRRAQALRDWLNSLGMDYDLSEDSEGYFTPEQVLYELTMHERLQLAMRLNPFFPPGELRDAFVGAFRARGGLSTSEFERWDILLKDQDSVGWEGELSNDALCEYAQGYLGLPTARLERGILAAWEACMKHEAEVADE